MPGTFLRMLLERLLGFLEGKRAYMLTFFSFFFTISRDSKSREQAGRNGGDGRLVRFRAFSPTGFLQLLRVETVSSSLLRRGVSCVVPATFA